MASKCTALDGNFVMNIGPRGEGSIRPEESRLIQEIGAWMSVNGDAIYGCGASGLENQSWGWLTRKGKNQEINAIVFNIPISGRLAIQLNKGETIKSAVMGNKNLRVEEDSGGRYLIHLPQEPPKTAFVVKVRINAGNQIAAEAAKI
jgi:alpha-L-fucosidase